MPTNLFVVHLATSNYDGMKSKGFNQQIGYEDQNLARKSPIRREDDSCYLNSENSSETELIVIT